MSRARKVKTSTSVYLLEELGATVYATRLSERPIVQGVEDEPILQMMLCDPIEVEQLEVGRPFRFWWHVEGERVRITTTTVRSIEDMEVAR